MRRLLRRILLGLAVAVLVVVLLVAATPQGKAAVRTALFVPQVLPTIPLRPQEWVRPDPVWQKVSYPTADGQAEADLILPAGEGKHSAVLFFLGVAVNQPRDDPRLVALAEGLARSGMVVMMPWTETQVQQRLVVEDLDNLVRAFQYLRTLDRVDPDRVGVGGYCTGASMVTVAAQDERIRDQVKFINSFAGYYDAFDFTKAIGTRSRFYGDYVVPWKVDGLTYRVFRDHLIEGVIDEKDMEVLTRMFVNREQVTQADVASLSPDAKAVYRLLNGVPYEEADALIEQLSPKTHEFLRRVSPSTNVDQLKARVLIMHDRADRLVPSEESRRFADALADHEDTYFTEFSLFQKEIQLHVDSDGGVGPLGFVREAFKLFLHMYNIMRDVS